MRKDDFNKWIDAAMQNTIEEVDCGNLQDLPSIRVNNDRYAKDVTLDERLSPDDKQMLADMGIAL